MPTIPIETGNTITAEQFNELVTLYNVYWHDSVNGGYSFDANHNTTNDDRRKGWGQAPVNISNSLQVNQDELITAEHTNYLISQINAGLWHMSETVSDLVIHKAPSMAIAAQVYKDLVTLYNTKFSPNHLVCVPTSKSITTNVLSVTNPSSSTWTDDLYCENVFQFDNYNEARHFFNSGGELLVDMSSSSGGTSDPSLVWSSFFDDMGIIRIGAISATNDGDGEGDAPFNSLGGNTKGFYSINFTSGNYEPVYDVAADDRTTSGGSPNPAFSDYNQRRFRILLKGEDLSPIFKVHLKIQLIEDRDDDSTQAPIDTNIVAEFGYAQPLDTPTAQEAIDNDSFSPITGINFKFVEREVPGIVATVGWTATDTGLPDGDG